MEVVVVGVKLVVVMLEMKVATEAAAVVGEIVWK